MNIKYVAVIVALCLAIVFLGLDKCGSSKKADELKGEWKKASEIAKVERLIKEETIKEKQEEIETLNTTIVVLNTTIAEKDKDLATIEDELGELKQDFESLEECQAQYNKLVEGFNLCKSINIDKDTLIFSLNKKYEAQVVISISYKDMYESVQGLVDIRTKQIKELEKINRRLKFTSGIKTGVVVGLAAIVIYGIIKQ